MDSEYTVLAQNRPIQVAFLINTESFASRLAALDHLIDAIAHWNNTHWGGRKNPIILFNGNALRDEDWLQLEVTDPDCLSIIGTTAKELIERLDERLHPWSFEVNDAAQPDGFRIPHGAEGIAVPPSPTNFGRLLHAGSGLPGREEKLLMFEFLDQCDPNAKRFVHRNFGTFHQWSLPKSKEIRREAWLERLLSKINCQRIPISDVSSLAAALAQLSDECARGTCVPAYHLLRRFNWHRWTSNPGPSASSATITK